MTSDRPPILILTIAGDYHAYAVADTLQEKGAPVEVWHTSDFPTASRESVRFRNGGTELRIRGVDTALTDPSPITVWNRRSMVVMDKDALHEADRKFAEIESHVFRRSLLEILNRRGFWVNPYRHAVAAEYKPFQHEQATRVGLESPDTLYGNDPEAVRRFIADHGGDVVYKGLLPSPWTDGERIWMPYTSVVTEDDLPDDDLLQAAPGIYQERVDKAYELRVTVIGHHLFAVKIHSQETAEGRLDWRKAQKEVAMERHELPPEIARLCHDLLERLGLVFGCVDFIVTPDGRHVFLEINQMGQFLFVEFHLGLPLMDCFCEMLIQGRPDFTWDREKASPLYTREMEQRMIEVADRLKEAHVPSPLPIWRE